jgi:hypothetical protein
MRVEENDQISNTIKRMGKLTFDEFKKSGMSNSLSMPIISNTKTRVQKLTRPNNKDQNNNYQIGHQAVCESKS